MECTAAPTDVSQAGRFRLAGSARSLCGWCAPSPPPPVVVSSLRVSTPPVLRLTHTHLLSVCVCARVPCAPALGCHDAPRNPGDNERAPRSPDHTAKNAASTVICTVLEYRTLRHSQSSQSVINAPPPKHPCERASMTVRVALPGGREREQRDGRTDREERRREGQRECRERASDGLSAGGGAGEGY